jgi:hypothetical protein
MSKKQYSTIVGQKCTTGCKCKRHSNGANLKYMKHVPCKEGCTCGRHEWARKLGSLQKPCKPGCECKRHTPLLREKCEPNCNCGHHRGNAPEMRAGWSDGTVTRTRRGTLAVHKESIDKRGRLVTRKCPEDCTCGKHFGRGISEEDALIEFEQLGLKPLEQFSRSIVEVLCECLSCGAIGNRSLTQARSGRSCVVHNSDYDSCFISKGYRKNKPGTLYVIHNPKLKAVKVGIANHDSTRLRVHQSNGWKVCFSETRTDGEWAKKVEKVVLRYWRDELKAPVGVSKEDMPQSGYKETAKTKDVGLQHTIDYIERLAA